MHTCTYAHRTCTACTARRLHENCMKTCTGAVGRAHVRSAVSVGLPNAGQRRGPAPRLTDAQADAPGAPTTRTAHALLSHAAAQRTPASLATHPCTGAAGGGAGQARGSGAARRIDAHSCLSSGATHARSADAFADVGGEHARAQQGAGSISPRYPPLAFSISPRPRQRLDAAPAGCPAPAVPAASHPPRVRASCACQPLAPHTVRGRRAGARAGALAGARAGCLDARPA